MTGEGEVSDLRPRRGIAPCGEGARHTSDDAGLQRGLVPRLRGALLFADLLEVVVDERPRALGDGRGHLLQARGHGGCGCGLSARCQQEKWSWSRGRSETLPVDVGAREHGGLRRIRLGSGDGR
jgi:hypothetical protein